MDRHDYRLDFMTDRSEIARITIPRANPDATNGEVRAAMESIINSDVVQTPRGEPMLKHAAELVTTSRREFTVAM